MRAGAGFWGLLLWLGAAAAAAQEAPAMLPRLSDTAAAVEYWDVAAQLDSGHRFVARFLITNEGLGAHTAAAIGHLILPDGTVTPIKYGRSRDGWTLSPDRRRLKIASAVLDMSEPRWRVEIDSDTFGFKVHLQLAHAPAPVSTTPVPGAYWLDVVPPTPARGTVWLRGMAAPLPVAGSLALTHTWTERAETELVRRRAELFARTGDTGVYLLALTLADGRARGVLMAQTDERLVYRADDVALQFGDTLSTPRDPDYPVPAEWRATAAGAQLGVRLRRQWLRWAPLDLVPSLVRLFLSHSAAPQLIWADADFELAVAAAGERPALAAHGSGLALVSFTNPAPRH
jgi:hypothetical protein